MPLSISKKLQKLTFMKIIFVFILFVAHQLQAQTKLRDSIFIRSLRDACAQCLDSSNMLTPYSQTLTNLNLVLVKINSKPTVQDSNWTETDIDFSIFPKLEYLRIEGTLLSKIVAWPTNLQALHLPANFVYVKSLPQLPSKLRYLQLNRDFNHLQEGQTLHFFDYQNLPNSLEVLIIEKKVKLNGLNYLPQGLKVLTIKNNAYITKNLLSNLPNTLKVLRLDSCQLTDLPDKLPDSLTHLYAQYNNLKTLPLLPATLQTLALNDNSITHSDMLDFPKLQKLDMNNNKMQYFQINAPNLTELKIDNNQLDSLKIYSLKLKYLTCTNNRLQNIWLDKNAPLRDLYCQHNLLTQLPFLSDSLQMLNCSHNLLLKLPPFGEKLHYIDYSENKIRQAAQIPPTVQQVVNETEAEMKVFVFKKNWISISTRRHYHQYRLKLVALKNQQWDCELRLQDNPRDTAAKTQLEKLVHQEQRLKHKYRRERRAFEEKD